MDAELLNQITEARERAYKADGARNRIERLVDPGTFVEYGVLAGESSDPDDDAPADGLVAGVGRVHGHPVTVASYDTTVRDGTQTDRNMRKLVRLLYLANRHRWPFVVFVDGDGARPGHPWVVPPIVVYNRGRFDVYEGLAELSGWAPTIAVISGRTLDGNAGLALLCDFVVATAGSTVGSRSQEGTVHTRPVEALAADGSVDLIVDDEAHAIDTVADYLAYWGDGFGTDEPSPTHSLIADIIPDDRRHP